MSGQLSLILASKVERGLKSYHQRRAIPGPAPEAREELRSGEAKAKRQESEVLAFFRTHPGRWTPSDVWQRVGPRRDSWHSPPLWPITSVRRAITNLTEAGRLRITMERRMGPWGRMEHTWESAE